MIVADIFAQAASLVSALTPSGNDVNSSSQFAEDNVADIESADSRNFEVILLGMDVYWNTGMDGQIAQRQGYLRFAVRIKYTDVGGSRRMHAVAASDMQGITDKVTRGLTEYGNGISSCISDGEATYTEAIGGEQTISVGHVPFRVEYTDVQVTS